uniref:Ras-associating domain-containing protein n=1 Tax=Megaselia scalaris TaxID=36166 RepID=T1GYU8_MEGSC
MDFEEFKKSVHLEYVNGANNFLEENSGSLKNNQRIDPSRINDSLKLYGGENPLSKSFNEKALRTIDPTFITDTLNLKGGGGYNLQKSSSTSTTSSSTYQHNKDVFEKGLNRSKSGPNCYVDDSDKDGDGTLKPGTVKRNGNSVGGRYVNIKMDCYNELENDESLSKVTDSNTLDAAGELTTDTPSFGIESSKPFITEEGVVLRRPPKSGSAAIKRRSGNKRTRVKLKRRCSINGHFYNRETSFFKPPYGSQMSVWVTSLVNAQDVINLILEKYKVDSRPEKFSLFVIKDNGEQKRLKDDEYP